MRTRRWLLALVPAIAIAVVAIVLIATSGDERESPRAATQADAAGANGKQGRGSGSKQSRASKKGQARKAGAPARTKAERRAARRTKQSVALNTTAGDTVLEMLGLAGEVRSRDKGRILIVTIPRARACDAVPADEERIRKRLLEGGNAVRRVIIRVAGTNQSLAAYVRANCQVEKLPGGPGRTVLRRNGEDFVSTKTFTIRGPRWAIDYRNDADNLFVFTFSGKEVVPPAIAKQERGTGTQEMEGRGRFRLEIRGGGGWVVRVRDGV